jgi:hypothetical protein
MFLATARQPSCGLLTADAAALLPLQGNVFINQYLIIKDIGKGAHGTVKLCLNTEDETLYAMKVGQAQPGVVY